MSAHPFHLDKSGISLNLPPEILSSLLLEAHPTSEVQVRDGTVFQRPKDGDLVWGSHRDLGTIEGSDVDL